MRGASRRFVFVLSFLCLGLAGGGVQAEQSGGWQTAYRSGTGPVRRPAAPFYGHGGGAERPIYHARRPVRRTGRRGRHDVSEPTRPYPASAKPYVVDVKGNRCTGFGRLFPLKGVAGAASGLSPQSSPDSALRRLGLTMIETSPRDGDPRGDSEMPAGYTFLAQFIDHDITFDTTSMLNMPIRDDQLKNARTPDLDLDSVYGGGPEETPYLYRLPYLRVGKAVHHDGRAVRYDLLRAPGSDGPGPTGGAARALIGDPRNDENSILAQLHAGFIALHNRVVDLLVEQRHGQARHRHCAGRNPCDTRRLAAALPRATRQKIFEAARDHVVHYYHRVIVEDFLPRLIGEARLRDLRGRGRDLYLAGSGARGRHGHAAPFIPVEFAVAAFRYGHSQVRETYWLRKGARRSLFGRRDARGGRTGAPAFQPLSTDLVVDWRFFFDIGSRPRHGFNLARRIDTAITSSLHDLGAANVVGRRDLVSLPARNLSRGRTLRLPSGQAVAGRILRALQARGALRFWQASTRSRRGPGATAWSAYLLAPDRRTRQVLGTAETPLWYYVLQEAAAFGAGARSGSLQLSRNGRTAPRRYAALASPGGFGVRATPVRYAGRGTEPPVLGHTLGPVGGTIVGEVLLGLVDNYRSKSGKGLGYRPEIAASLRHARHARLSATNGTGYGSVSGGRYTMRDFLIDAALADPLTPPEQGRIDCIRAAGEVICGDDRAVPDFTPVPNFSPGPGSVRLRRSRPRVMVSDALSDFVNDSGH